MTVREAVNHPIYKEYKRLHQNGLYDEKIYAQAQSILNQALQYEHALTPDYRELRVHYTRETHE